MYHTLLTKSSFDRNLWSLRGTIFAFINNGCYKNSCTDTFVNMFSFNLDKYLRMKLPGHRVDVCLTL